MGPLPTLASSLFLAAVCLCLLRTAAAATVTVDELTYGATGRCVPKTSDVCNGVAGIAMGSMIYVNDTRSEADMVSLATNLTTQLSVLVSIAPECYSATLLFLCLGYFSPCQTLQVNASFSAALPSVPCQAVCDKGLSLCDSTFKLFNQTYPKCPDTVVYDFTQSGAVAPITPNCSSGVAATVCQPLHELFIKPNIADRWYRAHRGFGWVGFVMNILLIVLYSVNPRLRKWPAPLVVMMAVGQAIFAMSLCLCSFTDRRGMFCNPDKLKLCKAQAACIFIGALLTISVWLMLTCLTLALVLSRHPKRLQEILQERWYLLLLVLIVPTIFCALGFRDLGPNSFNMMCTAYDADTLEQFVIWPVAAQLAIGTVAWIATVAVVLRNLSASLNWRRDIQLYLRLLIYELIALVPAILLVVPFESLRNRVNARDPTIFTDGSAKRTVESIEAGAILSPIFFASVFLVQRAHFDFIAQKFGYSTAKSTKSRSTEAEDHASNVETSKF